MSDEIDVIMAEDIPKPKEGKTYTIKTAEHFNSQVRNYAGIRVSLSDVKTKEEVIEILWKRAVVGANSKLGAFVKVLGKNISKWLGKTITFSKWREGSRELKAS